MFEFIKENSILIIVLVVLITIFLLRRYIVRRIEMTNMGGMNMTDMPHDNMCQCPECNHGDYYVNHMDIEHTTEEKSGIYSAIKNLDVMEMFESVEGMENSPPVNDKLELKQEDIPIKPTYFDNDIRAVLSGSDFMPPAEVEPPYGKKYGEVDALDDGAGGMRGLNYNLCSKSCCSDQYPTPHKMPVDKFVANSTSEFVPNSYKCNNSWQDSGCVCMTKEQSSFLSNRGGNA